MVVVCVICNLNLLVQLNNVVSTPCGHIFHEVCLLEWFKKSQTCPQCRREATEHTISILYFNCSDDSDSIVEDAKSLQNEIDNLSFQLNFKDDIINNLKEIKKKLEKQISDLRQEIKNVKTELNSKDTANHALQTQIKYFEQQFIELEKYKKVYGQLKEKVENLQKIVLLKDSESKVDKMTDRIFHHANFVTYIRVLRERIVNVCKRKELESIIKFLKQKLMESYKKCKVLEEVYFIQKKWEKDLLNMYASKNILLQGYDNLVNKYCIYNNVENQNYMKSNFEKCGKTSEKEDIATHSELYAMLQDTLNFKKHSCVISEDDNNKMMRPINVGNKRLRLENVLKKINSTEYLEKDIVTRCINIEPDNNDKKLRQKEKIDNSNKNKRLRLEDILKKINLNLQKNNRYINIEPDNFFGNCSKNVKSESFCSLNNCVCNRASKRSYTDLKISAILPKKLKLIHLNHETDLENYNERHL